MFWVKCFSARHELGLINFYRRNIEAMKVAIFVAEREKDTVHVTRLRTRISDEETKILELERTVREIQAGVYQDRWEI